MFRFDASAETSIVHSNTNVHDYVKQLQLQRLYLVRLAKMRLEQVDTSVTALAP